MNENIKQLQNTAGIQVVRTLMRGDENTEVKLMLTQTQLDRFAELLIKECAEVADNADATREKWQSIGKFVKEHFGVEE